MGTTCRASLLLLAISIKVYASHSMHIDNNVGCGIPSCPIDLGPNCPAAQKGPFDASGFPVGCRSACTVDTLNGHADNSPNCCSGIHDTQPTCPSSSVTNYHFFSTCFSFLLSIYLLPLLLTYQPQLTPPRRGQLPERLRLRVRRAQRHRALDLPHLQEHRIHHYVLSLICRLVI
jgi:hypothetical protein